MKKLQALTKILAIVLLAAIAFVGVYTQEQNRMENRVKDYQWGMNLKGSRVITLAVSEETEEITKDSEGNIVEEENKEEGVDYTTEEKPVNEESALTTENYQKTKEIIEKRLTKFGMNDYTVKLDEKTGKLVIEVPENDDTDHVVSNFSEVGKFEIVDSEDTENVLMDNNDIKKSNVLYNSTQNGTVAYLNIEFNKNGKEKLKNISTEYKTIEEDESTSDESTESENATVEEATEEENAEEETQKEITMQIDGNAMVTTSFDETMENGSLQLSMGAATTDEDELNDSIQSASTIATLLDTGNLPIQYEVEDNEYIATDYTDNILKIALIVAIVIILIALIVLIIKYKKAGLISAIGYIGMVAIYLLLIRYTNTILTLEGALAVALVLILNYMFNFKYLHDLKKNNEDLKGTAKSTYKDSLIKIIPVCILSIVFCFISWAPIKSFGITMFWGLVVMALYNLIVAREIYKSMKNKQEVVKDETNNS